MINPFAAVKVRNASVVWESFVICHAVSDVAAILSCSFCPHFFTYYDLTQRHKKKLDAHLK